MGHVCACWSVAWGYEQRLLTARHRLPACLPLHPQVNKERQFGFLLYGEDQLLPPTSAAEAAAAAEGAAAGGAAQEGGKQPEGEQGEKKEGAAAAVPAAAAAEGAVPAEAADAKPAAPAGPPLPRTRVFFHFKEVRAVQSGVQLGVRCSTVQYSAVWSAAFCECL